MIEAFPAYVAELVPQLDRALACLRRRGPVVEQPRLLGVRVVEPGEGARIRRRKAQGPFVLGRGLPMGAQPGRLACGGRRELGDGGGVSAALGVVGEARVVVAPGFDEAAEQRAMAGDPTMWRHLRLDGATRELVPEAQGVSVGLQEPGRHQLVEPVHGGA